LLIGSQSSGSEGSRKQSRQACPSAPWWKCSKGGLSVVLASNDAVEGGENVGEFLLLGRVHFAAIFQELLRVFCMGAVEGARSLSMSSLADFPDVKNAYSAAFFSSASFPPSRSTDAWMMAWLTIRITAATRFGLQRMTPSRTTPVVAG